MVFPAFRPQPAESLQRILLNALDHHHQVAPFHGIAARCGIVLRQFEAAGLQAFDIHHHAPVFGMKQFHEFAAGADEDEDITVLHLALHLFMYHSAQRTDTLAHVRLARTQEVAHRVVQIKHGRRGDFGPTLPSASLPTRGRSGHEDRWETAAQHHEGPVLQGKIP